MGYPNVRTPNMAFGNMKRSEAFSMTLQLYQANISRTKGPKLVVLSAKGFK